MVACAATSLDWNGERWLQLFQFCLLDMNVKADPWQVAAALRATFDDWDVCEWIAEPNVCMRQAEPLDLIDHDPAVAPQAANIAVRSRP